MIALRVLAAVLLLLSLAARADQPQEIQMLRLSTPTPRGFNVLIISEIYHPAIGGRSGDFANFLTLARQTRGAIVERLEAVPSEATRAYLSARGLLRETAYQRDQREGLWVQENEDFQNRRYSRVVEESSRYKTAHLTLDVFILRSPINGHVQGEIAGETLNSDVEFISPRIWPSKEMKVYRFKNRRLRLSDTLWGNVLIVYPPTEESREIFRPARGDNFYSHAQESDGPSSKTVSNGKYILGQETEDGIQPVLTLTGEVSPDNRSIKPVYGAFASPFTLQIDPLESRLMIFPKDKLAGAKWISLEPLTMGSKFSKDSIYQFSVNRERVRGWDWTLELPHYGSPIVLEGGCGESLTLQPAKNPAPLSESL